MTVGDLIQFIMKNQISYDANIYVERIEDVYFNEHHWKTKDKNSFETLGEKDKYMKIEGQRLYKEKDKNNIYLTSHY